MPIDPSIPLRIQQPQIANPLESYAKAQQIGNLITAGQAAKQNLAIGAEQLRHQKLVNDEAETSAREEADVMDIINRNEGNWKRILAEAKPRVRAKKYLELQTEALNQQKLAAQIKHEELPIRLEQMGRASNILRMGIEASPEDYARIYPQLAQEFRTIFPDAQLPEEPIPQADLPLYRAQYLSTEQTLKEEADKRTAKKAPFELREAEAKAISAEQKASGTEPIQPAQRATADAALLTTDQKDLAAINRERSAAGQPPMTLAAYLDDKHTKQRIPVPGVDVPLSPEVEAQRTRMNAARAQMNGLSPQQFQQANTLSRQLDSNPTVKNFKETENKAATVRGILNRKLGGPGDLAVVFEFMKGLDPTSVVRESEYETAAKSGNIFSGALAKFNGYLKPEGGFLPDSVKSSFMGILDEKLKTSKQQVKALYDDYGRRIDKITGQKDGKEWLTDYSSLMGPENPPAPVYPSGIPEVGGMFNGQKVLKVEKVK